MQYVVSVNEKGEPTIFEQDKLLKEEPVCLRSVTHNIPCSCTKSVLVALLSLPLFHSKALTYIHSVHVISKVAFDFE